MRNRKTNEEMVNTWSMRRRDGDISRVARRTNRSVGHVSNMISGRRRMTEGVARELYRISSRRVDNYTLATRHNMTPERVQYEFAVK